MDFNTRLYNYLSKAIKNDFDDNWDYYRFGVEVKESKANIIVSFKAFLKKQLMRMFLFNGFFTRRFMDAYKQTISQFEFLYSNLEDEESRSLLINVLAYRILGHRMVKIDLGNVNYFNSMKEIENQFDQNDFILPEKFQVKQCKFNLQKAGYPITLYLSSLGIFYDFIFKQYELKRKNIEIKVGKGETVIDGGGCFGDTALYFSFLTGSKGKVISFEFIPGNISLFNTNMELNPELKSNIVIADNPLWSKSDINVFYKDDGPGSIVDFKSNFAYDGIVKTITIDDYVVRNNIKEIDFIKLDIEGAEFDAIKGAENIIRRDKPKLAVALYHNIEDFNRIPQILKKFNPAYRFYFHHATINREESVLFAV